MSPPPQTNTPWLPDIIYQIMITPEYSILTLLKLYFCISDMRLVTCGQRVTVSGVMYQADIVTSDNGLSGYNSLFKPRL